MRNKYKEDEKLCIYLFPDYYSKLKDDAIRFEVYKKDDEPNINGLLCRVIRGFYESFFEQESEVKERIYEALEVLNLDEKEKAAVSEAIIKKAIRSESSAHSKSKRTKITLRPDANTKDLIDTIKTFNVGSSSISDYFARMLISYCDLPMSKREQIVFKDNYDKLKSSQKSKVQKRIIIKMKDSPENSHEVIPYKTVVAKEEMFNYFLCAEIDQKSGDQSAIPFRLNRIASITFKLGDTTISDSVKSRLQAMESDPQFGISKTEETCVKLTRQGVRAYKRIYIGRPNYIRKIPKTDNEYYYYFNCSEDQLFLYFRKLGCEAEVLEPKSLRDRLRKFHTDAANVYSKE